MARKRFTAEQIINHLREVGIHLAQGKAVREAVRQIGIAEQTDYRWRKEYGGMDVSQARRLKELESGGKMVKPIRYGTSMCPTPPHHARWARSLQVAMRHP